MNSNILKDPKKSAEPKLVFYPVPRCASATILTHLGFTPANFPYMQVSTTLVKDYHFKYTASFVRNPWERLLSAYAYYSLPGREGDYNGKLPSNFKNFVLNLEKNKEKCFVGCDFEIDANVSIKSHHIRPQSFFLNAPCDFIGRVENLQKDINILARKIGVKPKDLTLNLRKTNHKNYKSYYETSTKKIVEKLYACDIDTFKYTF